MQNPYNYKAPVKNRDAFFGREALIAKVYSRIGADRPQSISIVGDPKLGKSSLISYLYHEKTKQAFIHEPENYVYFYVPIDKGNDLSLEAFNQYLFKIISEKARGFVDFGHIEPGYDMLKKTVEALNQAGKKAIIFFDDFDRITQNESFPLDFFSFLRSLANNYDLAYVTSSYLDLQKLCVSKDVEESPFFNIFTNLSLKPFEEEEAVRLIEEPGREAGISLNEDKDEILAMAGLFPCSLQMACSILFDLKSDSADPNAAPWRETFAQEAGGYFESLWQWFDDEPKEIFQLILKSKEIDQSKAHVLDDLKKRHYIVVKENGAEFFSPVFREFVAQKNGLGRSHGGRRGILQSIKNWFKELINS